MTKQKRGNNAKSRSNDPNQDVQPWLGWIAAMLVVVIVVVAVAMGMERINSQRNRAAEVQMTPLVGGIEMPVATEASTAAAVAAEVTPIPPTASNGVTESGTLTMVTVITATAEMGQSDTVTATGDMTPTIVANSAVTASVEVQATDDMTTTNEPSSAVTATVEVMTTEPVTATEAVTATEEVTASASEPTATPLPSPTPRPTSTPSPTATSGPPQVFDIGAMVSASAGRVELHADVAIDAPILDSVGPGVALVVLPPSGDYEIYPVVIDGISWVRVRAEDGLVGWVQANLVEEQ